MELAQVKDLKWLNVSKISNFSTFEWRKELAQ